MSTFSGSSTRVLYWPKLAAGHASSSPSSYPPPAAASYFSSPPAAIRIFVLIEMLPPTITQILTLMSNHLSFQAVFLGVPIIWDTKSIQKGRKQESKLKRTGFRFADQ